MSRSGSPTLGSPTSDNPRPVVSLGGVAGSPPAAGGRLLPLSSRAVLETLLALPHPALTHQGVGSISLPGMSPALFRSQDSALPR